MTDTDSNMTDSTCSGCKNFKNARWIAGTVPSHSGPMPVVATKWTWRDRAGAWKVRWSIGRNRYAVPPGLYAVGQPDDHSPIVVSANYKLSFDTLRGALCGRSVWILVIDTRGINVWCAAGKGTFGTAGVIRGIRWSHLADVVSHRVVILPQLAAPGVAAHEVSARTGFRAVFGPVRAADLPAFLDAGLKASPAMRRVRFGWRDRVALAPVEVVGALLPSLAALAVLGVVALLPAGFPGLIRYALPLWGSYIGAMLAGTVGVPLLLPWIPARSFAAKGWILGLIWAGLSGWIFGWASQGANGMLMWLAMVLLLPAAGGFYGMMFTGASTYTSLSGVVKEMRVAQPLMALCTLFGLILLVVGTIRLG